MSRRMRILRHAAIGSAAVSALLIVAAIVVVQTDRFRTYVKAKIISATEEGTGGKVDLGAFSFDWKRLRAVVTDFVIHGDEPAGAAPPLRAAPAGNDLRPFAHVTPGLAPS